MTQTYPATEEKALRLLHAFRMEHLRSISLASAPPAVQKRTLDRIAAIQKASRHQAELAFAEKEDEENSESGSQETPLTEYEKKKVMRNKSAFISRRRTKNYTALLENLVQQSEKERDRELNCCVRLRAELELLKEREQYLINRWTSVTNDQRGTFSAQRSSVLRTTSASHATHSVSQPRSSVGGPSVLRQLRPENPPYTSGTSSRQFEHSPNGPRDPLSEILDDAIKDGKRWEF